MTMKQVQNLLQYLGYYEGNVDGIYGPMTRDATGEFQTAYATIGFDGIPGPETEAALLDAVATGKYFKSAPEETPEQPQEEPEGDDFWAGIKYFKREEFRCRCGGKYCNGFPAEPEEKLVRMADRARAHFGVPAIVSSGVRCETHNRNVGGTAASRHMSGKAMDVRFTGISSSMALPYVQAQPECRYAYAIDGNYIHMDIL